MSAPGDAIGRYTIEREVGRGAMGVVWVALDPVLGRRVAIKQLHAADALGDPAALTRFEREAVALARLRHPAIVRVHEVGRAAGGPFLVLDLVEGETLQDRLDRAGPLPAREAAEIAASLADALEHAHAAGVLHRDLKPANVLLDPDQGPRLTDFGLARDLTEQRERLTRTGHLLGTPAFMAPEQADGRAHEVDERSDVYGLAATLYALLTGRPPFGLGAEGLLAVLEQVMETAPVPPRQLVRGLPAALDRIVLQGLAKRRDERYPTAAALGQDLRRFLRGERVQARSRGGSGRVLARAGLALAGLAAAGLVLAAALAPDPPPPQPAAAAAPPPRSSPDVPPAEAARRALAPLLDAPPTPERSRALAAWCEQHGAAASPAELAAARGKLAEAPLFTRALALDAIAPASEPGQLVVIENAGAEARLLALSWRSGAQEGALDRWRREPPLPAQRSRSCSIASGRDALWVASGLGLRVYPARGEPRRFALSPPAEALATSPDGRIGLVASGGTLLALRLDGGEVPPITGRVRMAACLEDGTVVLARQRGSFAPRGGAPTQADTLERRSLAGGDPLAAVESLYSVVTALLPLGAARLAVGTLYGKVRFFETDTLSEAVAETIDPDGLGAGFGVRPSHYGQIAGLARSRSGGRLYVLRWFQRTGHVADEASRDESRDDTLELWCYERAGEGWRAVSPWGPLALSGRSTVTPLIALSSDGRRLAVATHDRLEVWSTPP